MRLPSLPTILLMLLTTVHLQGQEPVSPLELSGEDIVLERLPEAVVATIEVRNRALSQFGTGSTLGDRFLLDELLKWDHRQPVRVAFLGGSTELHRDIEDAAKQITEACALRLDFGFDRQTSKYRTWSTTDRQYAADIRVSFDQTGYFSLVGRDSVNPDIGRPGDPVGGRPYQRTLNLQGFHLSPRPTNWKSVVRHEFLHAIGFHHEHQNPIGPCEGEFRWHDDFGYEPTRDARGAFIADSAGRRPGIYTYLSGYPNWWSRATVDHNLRRRELGGGIVAGPFDAKSIMLYRFPASFYRSQPSPCAPVGSGEDLSEGDVNGLALLYPPVTAAVAQSAQRTNMIREALEASQTITGVTPMAAPETTDLIEVGRTKDACSRNNTVRFAGDTGDVEVAADTSKLVKLPALAKELTWYCGGSRERCANDTPFDHVLCERAGNGAISWIFYVER